MARKIGVVPSWESKLRTFLQEEGIPLEAAPGGEGVLVRIDEGSPKRECLPDRLYPEGRISCAMALEMARRLSIPPGQMGKLLNFLGIKIRRCQLGCF